MAPRARAIFIISGISTIIFGFLFGEFFGDFGEQMGWLEPVTFAGVTWNRRGDDTAPGPLDRPRGGPRPGGLGLGVANAVPERNRRHVCEKCGMIGVIVGLLIVLLAALGCGLARRSCSSASR